MHSTNQKLIEGQYHNISEAEEDDRISKLPDSILHYILSFLKTKCVARTCILSKRWNFIWRSIPTLVFPSWNSSSISDINKFMDFMDRTLLLHDASDIQKVYLETNEHFNTSRVHSWITKITSYNLVDLDLCLQLDKPFFLPVSLLTCESLTKLELTASFTVYFPKTLSFPKLQSLVLCGIQFTDDDCWNEQHFSNCPVLENLTLDDCTWFDVREFCILTPKLKHLDVNHGMGEVDGLQDCHLKIDAPGLVSFAYRDCVAKDYDLSRFAKLDSAELYFNEVDRRNEQWIGYGAAVTKFFQAISHVKRLIISAERLQVLLDADDFANDLPTFHNLSVLDLILGPARDNLISALLKAAPNLEHLTFDEDVFYDDEDGDENEDEDDDEDGDENEDDDKDEDDNNGDDEDADDGDGDIVETEEFVRHLWSVQFTQFSGQGRELRWAKLILKNAKSLRSMTIANRGSYSKQVVMSDLSSLPRASRSCVFEFL